MPYQLIPDNISRDTVEALQTLLDLAKEGEVTGIAFAVTLRKQRYITNVAGHCHSNPTFARGMVMSLSDEIAHLVHGRDPLETR
ncbi:hypothetical protein J7E70_02025 [Variovorax paradoxus]|nr:hypothetical protein [Variovorax paradoxus]MBT2299232.1 hypothetical protein [Variovorax paradoxus]